ncbi:hypothetical protein AA313_de0207368 [Arthrobotrys entomopaga]|nr:hypothetical protein AA313_de0207368 [Arthrobotrys entomopaga]
MSGMEPPPKIDENTDLSTVIRSSLGDSSQVDQISPAIKPADETNAWSQGLIADLGKVVVKTPEPLQENAVTANEPAVAESTSVPNTTLETPEASIDQQAEAFANIVTGHVESLAQASKVDETQFEGAEVPDVPSLGERPIITTTNTVPHVDAFHMGGLRGVPSTGGKPIITTTNSVPHADAFHMGDLPEILKEEEQAKPFVKVEPVPPSAEETVAGGQVADKTDLLARPSLVHDDSVYAITKDIPGAI